MKFPLFKSDEEQIPSVPNTPNASLDERFNAAQTVAAYATDQLTGVGYDLEDARELQLALARDAQAQISYLERVRDDANAAALQYGAQADRIREILLASPEVAE